MNKFLRKYSARKRRWKKNKGISQKKRRYCTRRRTVRNKGGHLIIRRVNPNGNCLFLALATSESDVDELEKSSNDIVTRAQELRSQAVKFLRVNLTTQCKSGFFFQMIIQSNCLHQEQFDKTGRLRDPADTAADYCERLSNDGEWGSTVEIMALSRVLNRQIYLYQGTQLVVTIFNETISPTITKGPLHILFDGVNHYDAILLDRTSEYYKNILHRSEHSYYKLTPPPPPAPKK